MNFLVNAGLMPKWIGWTTRINDAAGLEVTWEELKYNVHDFFPSILLWRDEPATSCVVGRVAAAPESSEKSTTSRLKLNIRFGDSSKEQGISGIPAIEVHKIQHVRFFESINLSCQFFFPDSSSPCR